MTVCDQANKSGAGVDAFHPITESETNPFKL